MSNLTTEDLRDVKLVIGINALEFHITDIETNKERGYERSEYKGYTLTYIHTPIIKATREDFKTIELLIGDKRCKVMCLGTRTTYSEGEVRTSFVLLGDKVKFNEVNRLKEQLEVKEKEITELNAKLKEKESFISKITNGPIYPKLDTEKIHTKFTGFKAVYKRPDKLVVDENITPITAKEFKECMWRPNETYESCIDNKPNPFDTALGDMIRELYVKQEKKLYEKTTYIDIPKYILKEFEPKKDKEITLNGVQYIQKNIGYEKTINMLENEKKKLITRLEDLRQDKDNVIDEYIELVEELDKEIGKRKKSALHWYRKWKALNRKCYSVEYEGEIRGLHWFRVYGCDGERVKTIKLNFKGSVLVLIELYNHLNDLEQYHNDFTTEDAELIIEEVTRVYKEYTDNK